MRFYIVTDSETKFADWSNLARGQTDVAVLQLERAATALLVPDAGLVFDIDLRDPDSIAVARGFLSAAARQAPQVFVCDKSSRRDVIQANSLDATDIIERPADAEALALALRVIRTRPQG